MSPRTAPHAQRALALVALACLAGGCIAPSVLDETDRAVRLPADERDWRTATATDLQGLFASASITGAAAASLAKLYYWFEPDGTYSGAALFASEPARFETLSGTWALDGDQLVLDDAPPATIVATDDALRLAGAEGVVVLVREAIL